MNDAERTIDISDQRRRVHVEGVPRGYRGGAQFRTRDSHCPRPRAERYESGHNHIDTAVPAAGRIDRRCGDILLLGDTGRLREGGVRPLLAGAQDRSGAVGHQPRLQCRRQCHVLRHYGCGYRGQLLRHPGRGAVAGRPLGRGRLRSGRRVRTPHRRRRAGCRRDAAAAAMSEC